jgi:ketosteroid isomerase-like protein
MQLKRAVCALCLTLVAMTAAADADGDALSGLLKNFLAHADDRAAHERFWAEDLVYTSSAGERIGKADILREFDAPGAAADTPPVTYSAEEIRIRQYGDSAVVAFRLVATPADAAGTTNYYFNTGTFVKRDGEWRAVAWQATRIPAPEDKESRQ